MGHGPSWSDDRQPAAIVPHLVRDREQGVHAAQVHERDAGQVDPDLALAGGRRSLQRSGERGRGGDVHLAGDAEHAAEAHDRLGDGQADHGWAGLVAVRRPVIGGDCVVDRRRAVAGARLQPDDRRYRAVLVCGTLFLAAPIGLGFASVARHHGFLPCWGAPSAPRGDAPAPRVGAVRGVPGVQATTTRGRRGMRVGVWGTGPSVEVPPTTGPGLRSRSSRNVAFVSVCLTRIFLVEINVPILRHSKPDMRH